MNLKIAIIGVATAVLAFGIGLGIPMISPILTVNRSMWQRLVRNVI